MSNNISRRTVLAAALGTGAAAVLTACAPGAVPGSDPAPTSSAGPGRTGRRRSFDLVARPVELDIGGAVAATWAYGGQVPGKALRAKAGERVAITFRNELPVETSVHWHGIAVANDMDGVPGVTTPAVPPGGTFEFDFVVPDPGTHWFHPHTGLQLDRGLYAPFIVDDPADPGDYDHEWVVVLDDWLDGFGRSPEQVMAELREGTDSGGGHGMGHGRGRGMGHGRGRGMGHGMSGMDSGDVMYPVYLANGRTPADPDVLRAQAGQRVRLRLINAAADTIFDVALGDHRLTLTHTDGFAVQPQAADSVRLGMGERYDAVVTLGDGVFPLDARAVGKDAAARALIRTGSGRSPDPNPVVSVSARALTVADLTAGPGTALPGREPDSVADLVLAGTMQPYVWTINGRVHGEDEPLTIRAGQSGRLRIVNHSMMPHPVHLHGHTFQVGRAGGRGPRKDTLLVPAMGAAALDFAADNPGKWMLHCHNAYHAEAGMMTRLDYVDA